MGPWLPEPVSSDLRGDGAAAAELADDVSMAMLIVLESLTPLGRAAFVLTDVFAMPSSTVALALDRSPDAVRQHVHRARSHVAAGQPRMPVDVQNHRHVTERFISASSTGDLGDLLALLALDVTLVTDGGGVRRAALRPIHGAHKGARWLVGVLSRPDTEGLAPHLRSVNGELTVVTLSIEGVDSVLFLTVEANTSPRGMPSATPRSLLPSSGQSHQKHHFAEAPTRP